MPTRNVVLTERQADLIETLVESGRYQNASEVMRDGLRAGGNNARRRGNARQAEGPYEQRLASASVHWIEANSKNLEISRTCKSI